MDRVLSKQPLNSEPSTSNLISSFLTPLSSLYNRNHGDFVQKSAGDYQLSITSEVGGIEASRNFTLDDLKALDKKSVITVLACAGNRRVEMNSEKAVEGLQWGGSALANCHFSGPLLREVLTQAGFSLEQLERNDGADLHIHFETTQNCQEDDFYGASLPVKLALHPDRPVLLALEQNHEPLTPPHGAPLRLVVPGVIGARSVKWLERIVVRDHESDCFYQKRDYKVLPPEASPESKEDYLKQTPALMEYPLNCEICEPSEGAVLDLHGEKPTLTVKGYAMGAHGIPISAVHVAVLPLPPPTAPSTAPDNSTSVPEVASSSLHQIRLAASALPASAWTQAGLDDGLEHGSRREKGEKYWGWTLFKAEVAVSDEVKKLAAMGFGGEGAEVALVAYAEDAEGNKQELQTEWNLRGVAEASWSVVQVKVRKSLDG
ncbi:hypothetical protein JCM10207_005262 [Rhodosporidiobolus poonsookiae]